MTASILHIFCLIPGFIWFCDYNHWRKDTNEWACELGWLDSRLSKKIEGGKKATHNNYTTDINHGLPESVCDLWWEYIMVGKFCKRKSDEKIKENSTHSVCARACAFRLTKIRFNSEPAQIGSRSHCRLLSAWTHSTYRKYNIHTHKHLSCHSALEPHEQK